MQSKVSAINTQLLLNLVQKMKTFVAILEPDGTLSFVNAAPLKIVEIEPKDVVGKKFWDCAWWNYDGKVQATIKHDCRQAAKGVTVSREIQIYTPHGLHWITFNIQPSYDENNRLIHLIAEGHSIAELKQVENHSLFLTNYFEKIIDHFNFPLFIINNKHQVIFWNKACELLTGLKAVNVIDTQEHWRGFYDSKRACLCDLVLNEKYAENLELYDTHTTHPFVKAGKRTQNWCHMPNKKTLYLDIDACPIYDADGNITAVIEVLNDVTEKILAEKALNESEQKYRNLFEKSADAFLILKNDIFVDCNLATVSMLGYTNKEEVLNTHPSQLSPPKQADGRDSFEKAYKMIAIAKQQGSYRFEWDHLRSNGEVFPVEVLLTAIDYGDEQYIHVVWRDITDRKHTENLLQEIAHYDVLTHLPNRILFVDRFNQAIAHNKRHKHFSLAVCFIDLDNFKPINDNYGHHIGDKLLVEVAHRITTTIREGDTVSRQGGDEFTLILCDIESYQHCEQLLQRIHLSLAEPYLIDGEVLSISASSGVTLYPKDNADLDTLLRHADQAMYLAKLSGKNKSHFFNTTDNEYIVEKHHRLQAIKLALLHHEMCLYYQPKVMMETGQVYGAEALIRWIHPEKGLIPPLDFLSIIEETELEIELGDWVINNALYQLNQWLSQGMEIEVSINISSYHLQSSVFFNQLNEALTQYPLVNSANLQLEILESSALGDIDEISDIIERCQNDLGVNIALDDFGTGYSSLTHMKNLSANTIKIDQSFVRDMLKDPDDYSIIEGVIGLANAFSRDLIAEGVETSQQGLALLMLGCKKAQGYGIAKPMPATEIPAWLVNYQANEVWINHASKRYTPQQQKIVLFDLALQFWLPIAIGRIATMGQEDVNNSISKKSMLGLLLRFKEIDQFGTKLTKEFTQMHIELYAIVEKLFKQHQSNDKAAAENSLKAFKSIYKNAVNSKLFSV